MTSVVIIIRRSGLSYVGAETRDARFFLVLEPCNRNVSRLHANHLNERLDENGGQP